MQPALDHMLLLAQAPVGARQIIIWSAILIGLVIVGYVLIMAVRSRVHPTRAAAEPTAFSLHDLRRLHREGKLTDEEFERARQRILQVAAKPLAGERPAGPTTPPDEEAADAESRGGQGLPKSGGGAGTAPPAGPAAGDHPDRREQDRP